MSNEQDGVIRSITSGGIVALHPARRIHPVLVGPSTSDEVNIIMEELLPVGCVRLNDMRFEFDSSIVGPEAHTELKELKKLRDEFPGITCSVFGHADPVGNDPYNKTLSGRRATAVYAMLTRKTDLWEELYKNPFGGDDWKFRAIQVMLTALGHYSGPINGKLDGPTRQAVEAFQRSPEGTGLGVDGDPGKNTRPKLYEAYMKFVCSDDARNPFQLDPAADFLVGTDSGGKGDFQGCSEFNPTLLFSRSEDAAFRANPDKTERNNENEPNRRVVMFLFRQGLHIDKDSWPCPRAKEPIAGCKKRFFADGETRRSFKETRERYEDTKKTFACRFYDRLAIESPCEIGPPVSTLLLTVHLKMVFLDPLNVEHVFPPNFPVVVVFGDGTSTNATVGVDGNLTFVADRRSRSFTLRFELSETNFLASAPPGASGLEPEKLVIPADLPDALSRGFRVFSVPQLWNLSNSDWSVGGTRTTEFTGLENPATTVGVEGSPVKLVLNPHWQFMKFLYFDRKLKRKLSIPPIMVEGFGLKDLAIGEPDNQSNWTTSPQGCQCLPWIVQDPPKPDGDILIRFTTQPDTFIEAPASGSGNPTITSGTPRNTPSADRLRFYDLPAIWKSQKYFTRLGSNAGEFETLAGQPTTNSQPLIFSLDDIVLTDDSLNPIAWHPTNDRAAIFSHKFRQDGDANLSPIGLYKPDTANKASFLTQKPTLEKTRNYIADYPDWTRLVLAMGNIHDVFDKRTPDSDDKVVGARAGVAWVDVANPLIYPAVFLPPPAGSPPGTSFTLAPAGTLPTPGRAVIPRPGLFGAAPVPPGEFCVVQPFYEQEHVRQLFTPAPFTDHSNSIGRCEMAILRCCDVEGNDEVAVNLHYFRFTFDFSPPVSTFSSSKPTTLTGSAAQSNFAHTVVTNIPNRWNGKDAFNSNEAQLLPRTAGALALKVRTLWFVQAVQPADVTRFIPHYRIQVFKEVRANMSSFKGIGDLAEDDKQATSDSDPDFNGAFAAAHETGHGDSLHDEYIETSKNASYDKEGFGDFIPGSPYAADKRAMMKGNIIVGPRNFWHVAEWLRSLCGVEFKVKHGRFDFSLPPHPSGPQQTFVTRPIARSPVTTNGARGRFDIYLYRLGAERYREVLVSGQTFDGIILVVVKMQFTFPNNDDDDIRDGLADIRKGLNRTFRERNRFVVRGTVGSETFTNCLLHISPRFLVTNFSGGKRIKDVMRVTTQAQYNTRVANIINDFGRHFRVNLRKSGGSRFDPAAPDRLFFDMDDDDLEDDFSAFFSEMMGVPRGGIGSAANYVSIARKVIPGATVSKLP